LIVLNALFSFFDYFFFSFLERFFFFPFPQLSPVVCAVPYVSLIEINLFHRVDFGNDFLIFEDLAE